MAGIKPVEVFERKQLEAPVVSAKGHRQNGFDLLRIIAATMVIYGHAFPLSGSVAPGILGNGAQSIGVKIFFIISGFLVTRSWLADPNLLRFAQRRAARIAPGLIVAVLFGTFVVGPLFTKISLAEYITSGTTWRYLANCVLYPVYSLPGVFQGNPFPNAVNGSLWSLPVEVLMYVLTPTILGTKAASRLTLSLFATALTIADIYFVRIAPPAVPPVFYGSSILQLLNVAVYFQIGALYALFHLDRYAFLKPSLFLLAGAGGIIHGPVVTELVLILLLPFAVVGAGTVH